MKTFTKTLLGIMALGLSVGVYAHYTGQDRQPQGNGPHYGWMAQQNGQEKQQGVNNAQRKENGQGKQQAMNNAQRKGNGQGKQQAMNNAQRKGNGQGKQQAMNNAQRKGNGQGKQQAMNNAQRKGNGQGKHHGMRYAQRNGQGPQQAGDQIKQPRRYGKGSSDCTGYKNLQEKKLRRGNGNQPAQLNRS